MEFNDKFKWFIDEYFSLVIYLGSMKYCVNGDKMFVYFFDKCLRVEYLFILVIGFSMLNNIYKNDL